MFDIGFMELLVLAVIGMVVIGPEKLPAVMRTVGKATGQARRFLTGIQNQIEQEVKLDELNKKIMAQEQELKQKVMSAHETEDSEVPTSAPEQPVAQTGAPNSEENTVKDDVSKS
jgi:sec-independent protein translocase protein TatB